MTFWRDWSIRSTKWPALPDSPVLDGRQCLIFGQGCCCPRLNLCLGLAQLLNEVAVAENLQRFLQGLQILDAE